MTSSHVKMGVEVPLEWTMFNVLVTINRGVTPGCHFWYLLSRME